jgi:hypothetical protein
MNAAIHADITCRTRKLTDQKDWDFFHNLHSFMDESKEIESTNRHRLLSHHLWFVRRVVVPLFGHTYTAVNGSKVNIKDVCEQDHILADFRYKKLPRLKDYVDLIESNDETEQAANKLIDIFSDNDDFVAWEFFTSPVLITGNRKAIFISCNPWMATLFTKIYKKPLPDKYFSVDYDLIFNNMKKADWINNGMGLDIKKEEKEKTYD